VEFIGDEHQAFMCHCEDGVVGIRDFNSWRMENKRSSVRESWFLGKAVTCGPLSHKIYNKLLSWLSV
jgi:hypothetical protein